MLNKEDLRQIGEVMDEKLVTFGKGLKIDERLEAFGKGLKIDEKLVTFGKGLKQEIVDEVVTGVGEMIEDNILPLLDEKIDEKLAPIKVTMVTKDYLDEKLGTTNGKISRLVNVLHDKRVITEDDKRLVLS